MRVIVFRTRLRDGISDEYARDGERIYELGSAMPGFVSLKDFTADDGERVAIAEFETADYLAAWRSHAEHAAAQQRGRDRYYASYSLQVCAELRSSKFDAATGAWTRRDRDPAASRTIAERWLACFNARDLDGLLALYADDARHTTPKLRARELRGKPALRAWWQDAFERLPSLRYTPTALTADERRVFMEYTRHVDGEDDYPVAEVLDIEHGKIVASRVFHG